MGELSDSRFRTSVSALQRFPIARVSELGILHARRFHEIFKYAHLKFTVCGRYIYIQIDG